MASFSQERQLDVHSKNSAHHIGSYGLPHILKSVVSYRLSFRVFDLLV